MTLLITGGAGFIGCNFAKLFLSSKPSPPSPPSPIVNLDKLTYAGHEANFKSELANSNYEFVQGDIADEKLLESLLKKYQPTAIINFAAESHVDRSIKGGDDFIQTNIIGSYNLLKAAYNYWQSLNDKNNFRFLQISTDEIYGSLDFDDLPFTESSQQRPSSLYSASKAAGDNLAHAYFKTYGLPVILTHSSNNYGAYQFPEKLIPLVLMKALAGGSLPIYGDGKNIRDWIHVQDNCRAIMAVLEKGMIGETYNIGGLGETDNLSLVQMLCDILDELKPRSDKKSYREQIAFVADRPGHDRRYAIDISKIKSLGWEPHYTLKSGLQETVQWYLQSTDWLKAVSG